MLCRKLYLHGTSLTITIALFLARKINVGKFLHKKTNVLIVTDVAVRNIILDNYTMILFIGSWH